MKTKATKDNLNGIGDSLSHLLEDVKNLHNIIDIAQRGINVTQVMPQIAKTIIKVEGENESNKNSIKHASEIAEIAKKEIENGFPFLHSQAALMYYSYLEGAIKRLIITYFKNNELVEIKGVNNVKITLSEFIYLDEGEKFEYIFIQFEKTVSTGIQYGISRFENLLSYIDFDGEVPEAISKVIFELSQIRNNILHRGAVADRFLIKNCPWLGYSIGDRIKVSHTQYSKYFQAIYNYTMLIAIRLGEKNGVDMNDERNQLLISLKD